MQALFERQREAFDAIAFTVASLRLDSLSVAPFTTGLGNEHPLENGFSFLNPYGLPYLPGSGVKGVLRQAARELASGQWGGTHGWKEEPRYPLIVDGKPVFNSKKQPVMLSMLDVLFGHETPVGESDHMRGSLIFWDVIPQIEGDSLMVEIMTPHQGHYYQWKKDQRGDEIKMSPHESGQPNPISFLTVPPRSRFVFHVTCDLILLDRLAPDLAKNGCWTELLDSAFRHAFDWLGFGAKTSIGYGAMEKDTAAAARREQKRQDREAARQAEEAERSAREAEIARKKAEEERLANLSPIERSIEEVLSENKDSNLKQSIVLLNALREGRWSGEERKRVAEEIKKRMIEDKEWIDNPDPAKAKKDKSVKRVLDIMAFLKE